VVSELGLPENVMVVPLTLMLSPFAKPLVSESEGAVPYSKVALVIGAGVASWLSATVPVALLEGSKKS
jgi:hypothetical protein